MTDLQNASALLSTLSSFSTLPTVSNPGSPNDNVWMFIALVCCAIHVVAFFIVCWRQGIFSTFGRRPISWRNLALLAAAAFLPALFLAPLILGPNPFLDSEPLIETALLVASWVYLGFELVMKIGKHIDTSEASPKR